MKFPRRIFTLVIGLVFTVSGFVKIIDPVGTSFIVKAYLEWIHLPYNEFITHASAVVLALVEAITGVALITGVFRRATAIAASFLILFFTLISIALVIFNPTMDCGCFGEFIHLSHVQTLAKNIILVVLCLMAFIPLKTTEKIKLYRYFIFSIDLIALISLSVYSQSSLPLFDFTAYRPGNSIVSEEMMDESDNTAILTLWDEYGDDYSDYILEGKSALISVYHPEDIDHAGISALAQFAAQAYDYGFTPYVVASSELDIPGVESFYADYKTIATLNRSNGGVTLLDDGIIIDKCSLSDLFDAKNLEAVYEQGATEYYIKKSTSKAIAFQGASLILFILSVI